MKLNRTRNAVRNAFFGVINRTVTIIGPFAVRTVFIHQLGLEFLGMNSLFSSILTILNLTELGLSSAIVFSMYKPIAEDDIDTIDALLCFYKRAYRLIGIIILGVGLLLTPFLNYLINGTYPEGISLVAVYIVYLTNTVLSYFMFAYLQALITAFQRQDLLDKVNIVISVVMYAVQITILFITKNYYAYLVIMPAFTVINNLRTAFIAKKLFPQYTPRGVLPKEVKHDIKEKVSGLMISKVCQVTRNSFDSVFISMFLGLTETAIYNNYYYIMNAVTSIMGIFASSVTAGVGNSVAMDSQEKNYKDMNRLIFFYMWVSGWFTICLLCLYQPFMELWVGREGMFDLWMVLFLCAYFYLLRMGDVISVYVQTKGLWWQSRFRSIAEALTNLVLNYFLGKKFGVHGIVLATTISLFFIGFFWGTSVVFKNYFTEKNIMEYYWMHTVFASVTCINAFVTYKMCSISHYEGIIGFVIKMIVCILLPNIIYYLLYARTTRFKDAVSWMKERIK